MWNTPDKGRLAKIPKLYETEGVPLKDKLVFFHFFIGGSDWYACEFDGHDIFFGFAILNGDFEMAEWGYFSLEELKSIKVNGWLEIDCELEEIWKIRRACEVDNIREAQFWPKPEEKNDSNLAAVIQRDVLSSERDGDHDRQKSVYP